MSQQIASPPSPVAAGGAVGGAGAGAGAVTQEDFVLVPENIPAMPEGAPTARQQVDLKAIFR